MGRELLRAILNEKKLRPALDAGLDTGWLNDRDSGSQAVFSGEDKKAYAWLLEHWAKHRKVPSLSLFRQNYPKENVPFAEDSDTNVHELVEQAIELSHQAMLGSGVSDIIELYDSGNIKAAVELLKSLSHKLTNSFTQEGAAVVEVGDPDIRPREMSRDFQVGVPVGVPSVDKEFSGMQPGQLITLLGTQKSGKTTFIAKSAYDAWVAGWDVLFFSVEMDETILTQRILSIGAHINPEHFRTNRLSEPEWRRVDDLYAKFTRDREVYIDSEGNEGGGVLLRISKKHSLITMDDVIFETQKYRPHIVYIDGFYFMKDRITGKMAGPDWQAHENLAAELKTFATTEKIPIFVSTQVQEKQYHRENGNLVSSMMGGTGLIRYSDLLLGLDKSKDGINKLTGERSRYVLPSNVDYFIDWTSMTYTYPPPEEEKFDSLGPPGSTRKARVK